MQPVTKDLTGGKGEEMGGEDYQNHQMCILSTYQASPHFIILKLAYARPQHSHTRTRKKGAKLKTIRLSASKDLRDRDGHEPAYSCSFALCKFPRLGIAGDEHESE